jgi:hypothetical protein
VKEQVALLISSARLILRVREVILAGNIEHAGVLAEEALQQKQLHYSAVDELRLYSKEINSALNTIQLLQSLRIAMKKGDIVKLEIALNIAKNTEESNYSSDLGILLTIDRAETVYRSLLDVRRQLASLVTHCYDRQIVLDTIALAQSFSMSESELISAKTRLDVLTRFEDFIAMIEQEHHGAISSEAELQRIIDYAHELQLSSHPKANEATLKRSLTAAAFRTALIAECLVKKNVFVIATETIKIKQLYLLSSKATIANYRLERFSQLRRPSDFGMRMCIPSEELRKTMLLHSDQPLPTSLTKQPPGLAALSVIMFSHYIRGIERSMYSDLRIVLRKLLQLGRGFPPIRDELLLQIVKQLRNNSDLTASSRLWRCLHACLSHFPPSMEFESYLESFLLLSGFELHPSQQQQQQLQHYHSILLYSQACIRSLHQSVIRFGYHSIIIESTAIDDSLDAMHRWLTSDDYDSLLSTSLSRCRNDTASRSVVMWSDKDPSDSSTVITAAVNAHPHIAVTNTKSKLGKKAPITASTTHDAPAKPTDPAFIDCGRGVGSSLEDAMKVMAIRRESVVGPAAGAVVRDSQDDWMQRFQKFCLPLPPISKGTTAVPAASASDHRLNKLHFMAAIAGSNTVDCSMDPVDRDMFYFLLFGKQGMQVKAIIREYLASHRLYHHRSKEEASQSKVRRASLCSSIRVVDKSSDLFFSQLKPSDLSLYADRFWSLIVDPLLQLSLSSSSSSSGHPPVTETAEGHPHAATVSTVSAASSQSSVGPNTTTDYVSADTAAIICDVYRDIVLVGMKKYVEKVRFGSNVHNSNSSSSSSSSSRSGQEQLQQQCGEDRSSRFDLTAFCMSYADDLKMKLKVKTTMMSDRRSSSR